MFTKKKQPNQNNSEKLYIEKKPGISPQAGQCLPNVHLMKKKINLIIKEEGIVLTKCVKS